MEPWSWILVYLVGFTLFQLLLFRYFSNGRALGGMSLESGETAGPQSLDGPRPTRESSRHADADTDGIHCPHCGAENDDEQPYTYCQNCLTQLR